METKKHSSHSRPVLSQAQNNTTLWIGHLKPHAHDHLAGQTFICPSEGLVNNIQVFASAVTQPGRSPSRCKKAIITRRGGSSSPPSARLAGKMEENRRRRQQALAG